MQAGPYNPVYQTYTKQIRNNVSAYLSPVFFEPVIKINIAKFWGSNINGGKCQV